MTHFILAALHSIYFVIVSFSVLLQTLAYGLIASFAVAMCFENQPRRRKSQTIYEGDILPSMELINPKALHCLLWSMHG